MWVKPWIQQRDDSGAYTTIMAELYDIDIPGFRNFIRMTTEFFEMLKQRLAPRLTKQTTNWREPLSVGLKIALHLTPLHLTPLPVQKWEGQHLQVCGPSLQCHH